MKPAALLPVRLKPRTGRGRILLWAVLVAFIFGAIEFGMPLEEYLRSQRNRLHRVAASGEIVLVAIDNRSLREIGPNPWPRRKFAQLVTELNELGARRIYLNSLIAVFESTSADDDALANALRRLPRKIVLPTAAGTDPTTQKEIILEPLPVFSKHAQLASINANSTPFRTVHRLSYVRSDGNRDYPSFAALLGGLGGSPAEDFRIDYSVDPKTVPVVSAADILNRKAAGKAIAGRDVVIGVTFQPYADAFFYPSYGDLPGTYLHILGAETLRQGRPITVSWMWPFLLAFALCIACVFVNRRPFTIIAVTGGIALTLSLPLPLEMHLIFTDVMSALFLLVVVGIGFSWSDVRHRYKTRATTNNVSGLPNLTALHEETPDTSRVLVAARVHNYAAIVSTLPPEGEKSLVHQMAKRLMVGSAEPMLYQGDEGIFAWFAEPRAGTSIGTHLDALHALFRNPVMVGNHQFDLSISFGFDAEFKRLIPNRLASALVAADEAQKNGLKWKEYDPAGLEESAWKLSLLSQLDTAIDAGDLWVAYQPKLDLKTGDLIGAEALARWTHAEKGPISPVEFILAAEQSNRIEKLTGYVLEQAIKAAAAINRAGKAFNMSVNLSARLIHDPQLVETVATMLATHGLAPDRLTLEVTETAALGPGDTNLATLHQLRAMGVYLSVDDYGTGMSTLDYLQRIPATEIKIDRSFVFGICTNHATKVMVNSTIQLAHSLGQKVVAEGVEDQETLDELAKMNCDYAQGYLIGRPVNFRALSRMLGRSEEEDAA